MTGAVGFRADRDYGTAYLHAGRGKKLHASPSHARAVVPLLLSPLGETYIYEGAATPAPLEQAVVWGETQRP